MKTSALMRRAYGAPATYRESVIRILFRMITSGKEKAECSICVRVKRTGTGFIYKAEYFDAADALKIYLHVENKLQGGNKK